MPHTEDTAADTRAELREVRQEVAELRRELDALRDEHAQTRSKPTPPSMPSRADGEHERSASRRDVLHRAGTVVAATLAGGAAGVIASAGPAAATPLEGSGNPGVLGVADPGQGTGIEGQSESGIGVHGSTSGAGRWGVLGETVDAAGTGGIATGNFGIGVIGSAFGIGTGVEGSSVSGNGLVGAGGRYGANLAGTLAPVHFFGHTADPRSSAKAHLEHELIGWDAHGLWVCVAHGTPGTWRKIAGPDTAGALHNLPTPVRVYDSRPGSPPNTGVKAPLAGGAARTVDLTVGGAVPPGATAALLSLTVAFTSAAGFCAVYRNGIPWPGTSNLNWSGQNQQAAVTTLTSLDAEAKAAVYANVATDVVVDVLGYYL